MTGRSDDYYKQEEYVPVIIMGSLSVAAAVMQFIYCSRKFISKGCRPCRFTDSALVENILLEVIVTDLSAITVLECKSIELN
jgi:hypothetical protein